LPAHLVRGWDRDWVRFEEFDCFTEDVKTLTKGEMETFASATSMFVIHYAFSNPEKARTILKNVSEQLCIGGLFVGTFADGDRILKHLQVSHMEQEKTPEKRQNQVLNVIPRFDLEDAPDYGAEYVFALEDAIDSCPEYLCRSTLLVQLAQEVGLSLIEIKPFEAWLSDYKGKQLARDEEEASCLYSSFVFKKVGREAGSP